jgi:ankyrin repeat protein
LVIDLLRELCKTLYAPTGPQNPELLSILNSQNKAGNTALHWAALNGHLEAVKVLLEEGADPTITNQRGHDAVFEAEVNDKREVVEWVLKEGGEVLESGVAGGEEREREGEEVGDEEMEEGSGKEDVMGEDWVAGEGSAKLEKKLGEMDI